MPPEREGVSKIAAGDSVLISERLTMKGKHNITRQYFLFARFFASASAKLESELRGADLKDNPGKLQHRAYVIGAVVVAAMGLEACANEIYLDACDKSERKLPGLEEPTMELLSEWCPLLERNHAPTLLKYNHALLLSRKEPFDKGINPYQDADHLICFRNVLVHYKPEWDDNPGALAELQSRLQGKFEMTPLATDRHLWFPHQCLGSGCAHWAVVAAEEFVRAFSARLGIEARI